MNNIHEIISEQHGCIGVKVEKETIGQFTGILDAEGNKVFENDMLEFPFDLGQAYVVYDGIRFAVKSEGSEAIDYKPLEVLKQCKIIGNIHE
nr:YopX family protein [uncultured Flavobacterium sp.]